MKEPPLTPAAADDGVMGVAAASASRQAADNLHGAMWITLAALINSQMLLLVRFAGETLPPVEIAFFRGVFGLIIILPFVLRQGMAGFRTQRPGLQILRGISSSLILVCGFYAIVHLPLAQVSAISFSRPLFVLLLAAVFLSERVRMYRSLATLAGFIGVLIIVRPVGEVDPAAWIALMAAGFVALNIILIKILTRTDRTATLVFYPALVQTIVLAIPVAFVWRTPSWEELSYLLGVGLVGTLMQTCVVRGYRVAEASALQPFDYTRLLFATAVGYFIFDELPDIWTWAGSAILIAATLYIARREAQLSREAARAVAL